MAVNNDLVQFLQKTHAFTRIYKITYADNAYFTLVIELMLIAVYGEKAIIVDIVVNLVGSIRLIKMT